MFIHRKAPRLSNFKDFLWTYLQERRGLRLSAFCVRSVKGNIYSIDIYTSVIYPYKSELEPQEELESKGGSEGDSSTPNSSFEESSSNSLSLLLPSF